MRKERWGLTARGWLVLGVVAITGGFALARGIYPFLAVTDRLATEVLVVEGWVPPFAVKAGASEFRAGGYERVFATGGPVPGSGVYTSDYDTSAHVVGGGLKAAGVPLERMEVVPAQVVGRDRTYNSALALRTWLHQRQLRLRSLNVLTFDAHARRTRLLFERAFGGETVIGIISVPNPDYDGAHWWRSSEGVREVLGETIAYLYAKLLF